MDEGQGLPISSIILIVIAIVVLAAILLFFFEGFSGSENVIGEHQFSSKCQDICASVNAKGPTDLDDARESLSKFGWCENHTVSNVGETTCADFSAGCRVESLGETVCSSCNEEDMLCEGCVYSQGNIDCSS